MIPRLISQIKSKQESQATPNDYLKWFQQHEVSLTNVAPVETEFASRYMIGFYTERYGFFPFYSQRLPKSTLIQLGTPVRREDIQRFSAEHYESLFANTKWNTLVAILTRIKDNYALAISTVYGVDIPVKLEPIGSSTT
jgi:hypothetical protein